MDALTWLPVALGVAALGVAVAGVRALALRAPLAAAQFARAVSGLIGVGDLAAARRLCDALRPAWGADLAARALAAADAGESQELAIEEAWQDRRVAAEPYLLILNALSRMAIPLALAVAIVQLGAGFSADGAAAARAVQAQIALNRALRSAGTGLADTVFCRLALALLQRQITARFEELRLVAAAFQVQLQRKTR